MSASHKYARSATLEQHCPESCNSSLDSAGRHQRTGEPDTPRIPAKMALRPRQLSVLPHECSQGPMRAELNNKYQVALAEQSVSAVGGKPSARFENAWAATMPSNDCDVAMLQLCKLSGSSDGTCLCFLSPSLCMQLPHAQRAKHSQLLMH